VTSCYSLSYSANSESERVAGDEPRKSGLKSKGLFFQEKEKRLSESKYSALAESHVPCFQERVGTKHPGYMIPDRLPWRHRARPSATLHEIQVRSPIEIEEWTCSHDATKSGEGRQGESHSSDSHRGWVSRSCWDFPSASPVWRLGNVSGICLGVGVAIFFLAVLLKYSFLGSCGLWIEPELGKILSRKDL